MGAGGRSLVGQDDHKGHDGQGDHQGHDGNDSHFLICWFFNNQMDDNIFALYSSWYVLMFWPGGFGNAGRNPHKDNSEQVMKILNADFLLWSIIVRFIYMG